MKRLFFGYRQKEICTKCGNINYAEVSKENQKDIYRPECLDCLERKVINIKLRRKHSQKHYH